MKLLLCVALVASAILLPQVQADLPIGNAKPKNTENNLINQTKGKFTDISGIIREEGISGAWDFLKRTAVQETQNQKDEWFNRFEFKLRDFQIGMAAGVGFAVLEFAFREVFPTWSWVAYAYKLSLS